MAENKVVTELTDYIDSHLSEKLSLDQLAVLAGYSKFHLNRIFMNTAGMTIHQYIQKKRLSEAARQLIQTKQAITNIAMAYGYESQQSFHLAFKNFYRETPLTYRKKYRWKEFESGETVNLKIRNAMKYKHKLQMKGVLAA
jgi:AraC-like DNA-binding protein